MGTHATVPAGLTLTEDSCSPRGEDIEIPFQYGAADSLDAIREAYADAGERLGKEFDVDSILLDMWNQSQRASASNTVLNALRDDDADVDAAVSDAVGTLIHTGRTGGGGGRRGDVTAGLNKTRQAEFGKAFTAAVAEKGSMLTKAEIEALCADFGLDPSKI